MQTYLILEFDGKSNLLEHDTVQLDPDFVDIVEYVKNNWVCHSAGYKLTIRNESGRLVHILYK